MLSEVHLPVPLPPAGLDPTSAAARLLAAFLSGRKAETILAYRNDLEDFRKYLGVATLDQAAQRLLAHGHGEANALALAYKAQLMDRNLAALTINRRLTALRSMIKLARTLGLIPWTLEVQGLKAEPYRDTRGPGRLGFRSMLELLAGRTDAKSVRDRAILRCLFDLGLRRAETIGLDLADVDGEKGTLAILGKGRTAKINLTMPPETKAAVDAWISLRGEAPGPLFTSLDRAKKGNGRLGGRAVHQMVQKLGKQAGLKVWPHGLRHASITSALDLTGGNVRAVQKFSRHKDVRVLERYDDCRRDLAGDVAKQVAASVQDSPAA
jgi:integrase/recombinase XerC